MERKRIKRIPVLVCWLTVILSSITPAFAVNDNELLTKFAGLFSALRGIGLAGALISLAITGMLYVAGNEQSAAKAKTAALYICLAVAAMYLLPSFVGMGVSWGISHAWTPPGVHG